jgi:hypothetical protein
MKNVSAFILIVLFTGSQLPAQPQASLAGVVINVDNGDHLAHVIVRVTLANCDVNCPKPRFNSTDDEGQFLFYELSNARYELDVIGIDKKTLLHREIIDLPRDRQKVVKVSLFRERY